jgi:hypothetical protein
MKDEEVLTLVFWNGILLEEDTEEENDYCWREGKLCFHRRDVHPDKDKVRVILVPGGYERLDFEVVPPRRR